MGQIRPIATTAEDSQMAPRSTTRKAGQTGSTPTPADATAGGRSTTGNVGPDAATIKAQRAARIARNKQIAEAAAAKAKADGEKADKPADEPKPPAPAKVKSTPTTYRAARAAKQPGVYLTDEQLVAEIRKHASEHYNEAGAGWHILAEAWDDAQIIAEIGWTDQLAGALKKLRPGLRIAGEHFDEQLADAKISAGESA
jgi:hypothetical protein